MGFYIFLLVFCLIMFGIKILDIEKKIDFYKKETSKDILELKQKIEKLNSQNTDTQDYIKENALQNTDTSPENIIAQEECITTEPIIEAETLKDEGDKEETEIQYKEYQFSKTDNKTEFDLEKIFMGNLFVKIGIVALIIAFIIFIKFISQYITFTPVMKIAAGYIISMVLIGFSFNLHKKENMKKYSESLLGLGFAISFIATYASCTIFNVFSQSVATVIGFMLIILTFICAHYCKTFSTVAIGLIGGYLNPFVIDSSMSSGFLFGYLILLNAVSIVYVLKNSDKMMLNMVNLILSTVTVTLFALINQDSPILIYPIALWLIYFINDVYFMLKNDYSHSLEILNRINFSALIWFVNFVFNFENKIAILSTTAIFGILYIIIAILASKNRKYRDLHISNGLLAFLTASWFIPDNILRTCVWSIEGLICAVAHYIYNIKDTKDIKDLEKFIVTFLSVSTISTFFQWETIINSNIAIVLFAFPALCSVISAKLIKSKNKNIAEGLNLSALTLVFIYLSTLVNKIETDITIIKAYTYIIIGLLYGFYVKLSMAEKFKPLAYFIYTVCITALLITNFIGQNNWIPFANFGLVTNAFAIFVGCYFTKKDKENADRFKIVSLTLGFEYVVSQLVYAGLDGKILTYLLIIIGFIYSLSCKFITSKTFEPIAHIMYAISIIALLISTFVIEANWIPILNIQMLANIIAIAIGIYYSKQKSEYCDVFKYIVLSVGLLLVFGEFGTIMNYIGLETNSILYSSVLILYSAALMIFGIFKKIEQPKKFGIYTTLFFIAKILFYDLAEIDAIFKLIAFVIVGVSLLLVSYFYQKYKD